MARGTELLPYPCQRVMVEQFESLGHEVVIRRNKHGSLRFKIDGRKTELQCLPAFERIQIALAKPASKDA